MKNFDHRLWPQSMHKIYRFCIYYLNQRHSKRKKMNWRELWVHWWITLSVFQMWMCSSARYLWICSWFLHSPLVAISYSLGSESFHESPWVSRNVLPPLEFVLISSGKLSKRPVWFDNRLLRWRGGTDSELTDAPKSNQQNVGWNENIDLPFGPQPMHKIHRFCIYYLNQRHSVWAHLG